MVNLHFYFYFLFFGLIASTFFLTGDSSKSLKYFKMFMLSFSYVHFAVIFSWCNSLINFDMDITNYYNISSHILGSGSCNSVGTCNTCLSPFADDADGCPLPSVSDFNNVIIVHENNNCICSWFFPQEDCDNLLSLVLDFFNAGSWVFSLFIDFFVEVFLWLYDLVKDLITVVALVIDFNLLWEVLLVLLDIVWTLLVLFVTVLWDSLWDFLIELWARLDFSMNTHNVLKSWLMDLRQDINEFLSKLEHFYPDLLRLLMEIGRLLGEVGLFLENFFRFLEETVISFFINMRSDFIVAKEEWVLTLPESLRWSQPKFEVSPKSPFWILSDFSFSIDPFNYLFVLLTAFIMPFALLSIFESITFHVRIYTYLFFFLVLGVLFSFLTFNLFFFYFFFECILLPMFFMIGFWGSSRRRTLAANYFFFFTLSGSILLLIAIFLLTFEVESLNLEDLLPTTTGHYAVGLFNYFVDANFIDLNNLNLDTLTFSLVGPFAGLERSSQIIYWWLFFLPFAVKIPMIPFHIWLPEAHVEAPTSGSIFLAALLLKLGGYGFMRYLVPLFPFATIKFQPLFFSLAFISILYSSFAALRQIDIKRIVAYSSIAHMNFAILGLFVFNFEGFTGSVIIFLGHGLVASGLFFLIGVLYDRYKTRLIFYYSGLAGVMPLFATYFFFFSLGNIAFPGTISFIGELFILFSLANINGLLLVVSGFSLFFALLFTFWLYTRLCFGTLKRFENALYFDLSRLEHFVLLSLLWGILILGFKTQTLLRLIEVSYGVLFYTVV